MSHGDSGNLMAGGWRALAGGPSPASLLYRAPSPCLGLLTLRGSECTRSTAMKCLLLALGLSLMCGNQATDIPQTMQDLDLQEVRGWPGWAELRGGQGAGSEMERCTNGAMT